MLERYAVKIEKLGNDMVLTKDRGWVRKSWTITRSIENSREAATQIANEIAVGSSYPLVGLGIVRVWIEKLKEPHYNDQTIGSRIKRKIQDRTKAKNKKG